MRDPMYVDPKEPPLCVLKESRVEARRSPKLALDPQSLKISGCVPDLVLPIE
jgi:hypothetical protein